MAYSLSNNCNKNYRSRTTTVEARKRGKAQRVARTAWALCDCTFLTHLQSGLLLPPSGWPLSSTARILASLKSPAMQMGQKISGITWPKFTKFLAVEIYSTTVLTQQSRWDPSTRCRMRGATLKKKVTSAKYKLAGGIAMPGGLIIVECWVVYFFATPCMFYWWN